MIPLRLERGLRTSSVLPNDLFELDRSALERLENIERYENIAD